MAENRCAVRDKQSLCLKQYVRPMKGTILFGCLLFLFCGHVFSQGYAVFRPCSGVLINDMCWAENNVDRAGTFAAAPEAYGMLYQWNRKKEWPCPAGRTSGKDAIAGPASLSGPDAYWEAANDPCPPGWRVPAIGELYMLMKESQVEITDRSRNGTGGVEFRDKMTGNAIFLPFICSSAGRDGAYWSGSSSLHPDDARIFFLVLTIMMNYAIVIISGKKIIGAVSVVSPTGRWRIATAL